MAISFVNSSSFSTGTTIGQISTVAPGISVTLGNLLVAAVFLPSGGSAVTFSASSTSTPTGWTCVKTFDNTSGGTFGFCYAICSSSIPSDLVTVSWGTLINQPNVIWTQYLSTAGWLGVSENPASVFTVNLANTNLSGGPMTTTHVNSVIIAKVEYNPSGVSTGISSGWTSRATVGANLSNLFDNIVTPGTYTLTATTSTTGWMCDMHALFDASGPPIQSVTFNGIQSSESIGTPSVAATGTAARSISGILSSQSFGVITVLAPANIAFTGILSSESLGSVSVRAPATVAINGISSGESFYNPIVASTFAPILFVQTNAIHTSTFSTSVSIPFLSNITLGNFIILLIEVPGNVSITSVIDSVGNTYQNAVTKSDATNNLTVSIYYASITTGSGTKPTVTATYSVSHTCALFLYEFSGINNTSPIDSIGASSPTGSSGISVSSTSMATTSNPTDLIIGGAYAVGGVIAYEPGWIGQSVDTNGTVAEYRIVSSTGVYAATFTTQNSSIYVAVVASFKNFALGPPAMMALVY